MNSHGLGLGPLRSIGVIAGVIVVAIHDHFHPPGPIYGYNCRPSEYWSDGTD